MMTFLFGFIVGFLLAVVCVIGYAALVVSKRADAAALVELRRVE